MKLLNNRKISIYGIVFNCIRKESFFELESTYRHYITINSEILIKIIKLDKLRKIYEKSFTTIDSALLFRYLKYRYPKKQIEKLSGSDLLFDIIKNSKENNRKIFFLGGTKKSNNKCVQLINSKYGGNAIGFCPEIIDNKLSKVDEDNFIDLLQSENPYYLLVGLGCPKQEYFINHYENLIIKNKVKVAIGVGGAFDFLSGYEKRAPYIFRFLLLEWFFRLIQNPKRIIRVFHTFYIFIILFKDFFYKSNNLNKFA